MVGRTEGESDISGWSANSEHWPTLWSLMMSRFPLSDGRECHLVATTTVVTYKPLNLQEEPLVGTSRFTSRTTYLISSKRMRSV